VPRSAAAAESTSFAAYAAAPVPSAPSAAAPVPPAQLSSVSTYLCTPS